MSGSDYARGNQAAWRSMLGQCMNALPKGNERDTAALVGERAEAVAMLRDVCSEYGDNDWPDDLHLADVIEKHLLPHLQARDENDEWHR